MRACFPWNDFVSLGARMTGPGLLERVLERVIFAARWIMVPFYLGLLVSLGVMGVKFVQELIHYIERFASLSESDTILMALTLIDLSLAGNLLLIVAFSGYENFVSKLDVADHPDRPEWLGKIDFSGMKLKLVASIIAISGIQLLKQVMEIESANKTNLGWLAGIHMTFVVSGVLLALMDFITARAEAIAGKAH
jgi:uncharacterized protein (TIGR00645 family)